uniref:F-box domain-containing protein n=1 Tax=Caenorhabditis tropicalis TaxID=1561998 RepID=A0A1I7THR7_9PELO
MPPFPLLEVPHLPLSHILKDMSIQELLNLSFKQNDIQDFLKMIPIRSGGYSIYLYNDGIRIKMGKQNFSFECSDQDKSIILDGLNKNLDYFKETFPGEINKLDVNPSIYYDQLDRIPKECHILSIGSETDQELADFETILQQINFKSGLILKGPKSMKTENSKLFHVDYLKIGNSEWMTSSILESLQNEIIHLQFTKFTDSEINSFLLNLKNGNGNNRLKLMTIERENAWNMDEIVKELDTFITEKQSFPMDLTVLHADFLPFSTCRGIEIYNSFDFITENGTRVSVDNPLLLIRIFIWSP